MTAVTAEIRQLSDAQLADLYGAGGIDLATLTAESDRRDRADKARARRAVEDAAWYDAAYAQYLAADAACRGHLFKPAYRGERGPADAMALWRGPEAHARKYASEDLCDWWDANGGRLSLARYRRDQAMARRADRDARDLAAMDAAPKRAPKPVAAPVAAPRPAGSIARMITALGALQRQADRTARAVSRVSGGVPA